VIFLKNNLNEGKIFKQFVYNDELTFSEIFKKTKISSNLLAYFLKKMVDKKIIEKKKSGKYALSNKGEKLIPFYTEQESLTPLVVLLIAIVKDEKVLLIKREKRPYKGLWSLISGRMLLDESIECSVKRILQKKIFSDCYFKKIHSVIHERLVEKESKHSFIFFFVSVEPKSKTIEHSGLKWFDLNKIPKRGIIASDYWLIKNKLDSSVEVIEEVLSANGRKIKFV
jgi:ADP-ribose pyrophosphatase YjhB (NUDIX family)